MDCGNTFSRKHIWRADVMILPVLQDELRRIRNMDCSNCGMSAKDRCECDAVPGGLFKCWRPKGAIIVWDDEEVE
jgi:hypothetical protein